jgi:hypothetical protein
VNYTSDDATGATDDRGNPIFVSAANGVPSDTASAGIGTLTPFAQGVVGQVGQDMQGFDAFIATFELGSIAAGVVLGGFPALAPETLYHFTTEAGYDGIVEAGQIIPGNGITGFGVYGTAVPSASSVSWAGVSTEAIVPFSPGLSPVTPGLVPFSWWSVQPTVTTLFQYGVPIILP